MAIVVANILSGIFCLFVSFSAIQDSGNPLLAICSLAFAAFFFWNAFRKYREKHARKKDWRNSNNGNAVRSDWEAHIANHIRYKFPSLTVITNDRSIIRAKGSLFRKLEIDIWMPSIRLGIEANGERYHDHAAYSRDVRNGTCYSKEMYKEQYCKRKGITLIHVWDSENFASVCNRVDNAIRQRL